MRRDSLINTAEVAEIMGCTPTTARLHMLRCGGAIEGHICPHCGVRSPSMVIDRKRFMRYYERLEAERPEGGES